jgi:hypothetical protein
VNAQERQYVVCRISGFDGLQQTVSEFSQDVFVHA